MDAAAAGLLLLEWGVPLSDLFDLARRHHAATEAVAREAVAMFATHVRGPLRARAPATGTPGPAADGEGRPPGPGLRRAAPGGEHPGRPPLHPDAAEGGPRPRRAGGLRRRATGSGPRPATAVADPGRPPSDAGPRTPPGPVTVPVRPEAGSPDATGGRPPRRRPRPRSTSTWRPGPPRPTCPTGRGEDRPGALDVRHHRPPLRPGQPADDLRARRPVAAGSRSGPSACRPGRVVLDLACGTGDFLTILTAAGLRPFGMDLSWGMLAANRTGAPLAQVDGAALPAGRRRRSTASPAATPCATSPSSPRCFAELGRVVRPGGRHQPPRGGRARPRAAPDGRPHLVPPGGAGDRRPALRRGRLPVPAPLHGLPARRPPSCGPCSAMPASPPSTGGRCRAG